jgi:hypothetical protein
VIEHFYRAHRYSNLIKILGALLECLSNTRLESAQWDKAEAKKKSFKPLAPLVQRVASTNVNKVCEARLISEASRDDNFFQHQVISLSLLITGE